MTYDISTYQWKAVPAYSAMHNIVYTMKGPSNKVTKESISSSLTWCCSLVKPRYISFQRSLVYLNPSSNKIILD